MEVNVVRGCPQAGPLLGNLLIDPLLHSLTNRCAFTAFTDDLLLLVEGQSIAYIDREDSELMDMVDAWGSEVG